MIISADVLQWLAGNSSKSLDIIAQYWQLVPRSSDPRSGDYGYSDDKLRHFGANQGLKVYKALETAANRKLPIR